MQTKKIKAIWFSRHEPSPAQLADLDIANIEAGMALGAQSITSPEEAAAMARTLRALAKEHGATAVAGVFSTAMLEEAWKNAIFAVQRGDFGGGSISLLAAVNESRTPEGGTSTFAHLRWGEIGVI
jgi:hypothetical protein